MSQSFTNLIYHVVFSTKNRLPFITEVHEARLYEYIGGTVHGLGGISLELNGTEDHIHLLAKLRPDKALSDMIRQLKANASGWMHNVFPALEDFSWQRAMEHSPLASQTLKKLERISLDKKCII